MSRFFAATRYLIIIPIIGLGFAAAAFFLFGGVGLIRFLVEAIGEALGLIHLEAHEEEIPFVIEVVEFGVTVVVLAVNFLSVVFTGENVDLIAQGAGIALPIAALGIFIGLRAWASGQSHVAEREDGEISETSESAE